jgi:hypothetical protein
MFVPILIGAALLGFVAWVAGDKKTGVTGFGMGNDLASDDTVTPTYMPPPGARKLLAANGQQRLAPEQERLLALLVLFARDKKYPAGQKRYLSASTALDAVQLARQLNLPATANAIRNDGPIPDNEFFPGRADSIRKLTVTYGTTGRA